MRDHRSQIGHLTRVCIRRTAKNEQREKQVLTKRSFVMPAVEQLNLLLCVLAIEIRIQVVVKFVPRARALANCIARESEDKRIEDLPVQDTLAL